MLVVLRDFGGSIAYLSSRVIRGHRVPKGMSIHLFMLDRFLIGIGLLWSPSDTYLRN